MDVGNVCWALLINVVQYQGKPLSKHSVGRSGARVLQWMLLTILNLNNSKPGLEDLQCSVGPM